MFMNNTWLSCAFKPNLSHKNHEIIIWMAHLAVHIANMCLYSFFFFYLQEQNLIWICFYMLYMYIWLVIEEKFGAFDIFGKLMLILFFLSMKGISIWVFFTWYIELSVHCLKWKLSCKNIVVDWRDWYIFREDAKYQTITFEEETERGGQLKYIHFYITSFC